MSVLRVVSAGTHFVSGPLVDPIVTAQHSWSERSGLRLELGDGARTGQGEASPLPGFSLDHVDEVPQAILCMAQPVIDEAAPLEPQLEALLAPIQSPAGRFAAETALLDLLGQRRGVPVHALLGGPTAPAVPLSTLLPCSQLAVEAGRRALERGITTLKVKIGRPGRFAEELALLSELRTALGREFRLRLDANGAFAASEVEARLDALAKLDVELIEEPCEVLPASSPVPIALDESLLRLDEAALLRLYERGVVRALILKPTLLGGALRCLTVARAAQAHGVACVVTHAFEGPIALAACAELALCLPPSPLACGLDRHAGLASWPAVPIASLEGPAVRPTTLPGLGLPRLELQ